MTAEVRTLVPEAAPISVNDLLRWPGVMLEDRMDPAQMLTALSDMASLALEGVRFTQLRQQAVPASESADKPAAPPPSLTGA